MSKTKSKILAIDPGTKFMGVALLEDGKLIYHGVKVIKQKKSPHETLNEGRKIIHRLINDLKPNILAVEKTFFANNRNSSLLNVFADEIKIIGKRKGLKVVSYAPNTVKKFICGNGRASKEEVATVIVSKFPELKVYLSQDRKWKDEFHQNMFDAVAVGMVSLAEK
ncbi:MAG: crossover junction endodeoxyribonuclease RuvC [Candidatus Schekmanbacteria bacterium]|nr:crossover junction endodeoxyribonuclease RuvC [Candidatus Schekmanbacteria bacterium]